MQFKNILEIANIEVSADELSQLKRYIRLIKRNIIRELQATFDTQEFDSIKDSWMAKIKETYPLTDATVDFSNPKIRKVTLYLDGEL